MQSVPWRWLACGAAVLLAQAACAHPLALPTAHAPDAQASQMPPAPLGRLEVSPAKTEVLQTVSLAADGLPPDTTVALTWQTVDGGWQIADYYKFLGKRFQAASRPWGEARTDASGRLDITLTVPEDYGGVHEIVASVDGVPVARGATEVVQSFEISATAGAIGSPIAITARGLGWQTMESTWVLTWDNHEVGWVSAVDTRGTAVARLRAAGPVGPHYLKLWSGWQGQAYINHQQAPTWYLPRPEWTFVTTDDQPELASYVEPYPDQRQFALTALHGESGASVTPAQGPILTEATVTARGLPPDSDVSIVWERQLGNRVEAAGFKPDQLTLGAAHVDRDGTLRYAFTVPDDLGGAHPIRVLAADGRELASAAFAVETSLVSVTPSVVGRGETFAIQLKGVGWTEYDNILNLTYDNAYLGYACGFTSQGDVLVTLTATGAPGVHTIDFYPGLFKGPPDMPQQLYRLPQLTYLDDHPGNRLPAVRVTIEVVDD
ncbi:MAG TPA: hypothetical protein VK066_10220 [Chloroflexota bacterium]|nr:hypothetical protein [Chloroflexota bacterium]